VKAWISCREAGMRMSRRLDDALPATERVALLVHLGVCSHCRRLQGQMLLLGKAFRRLGRLDDPPGPPARD